MSVRALENPNFNVTTPANSLVDGPEQIPSSWKTVQISGRKGLLVKFTPSQTMTLDSVLLYFSQVSSQGAVVNVEVLNPLLPASLNLLTNEYLPQADTSIDNFTTDGGSASNLYQKVDENWSSPTLSDWVKSGIFPVPGSKTNKGILLMRATSGMAIASTSRVRGVWIASWATSLQTQGRWTASVGIMIGGVTYPSYPGILFGNNYISVKSLAKAWGSNPATGIPWTPAEVNTLDDSSSYGWGLYHIPMGDPIGDIYRVKQMSLIVPEYQVDNRLGFVNGTALQPTTLGIWRRFDLVGNPALTSGTAVWLHIWCSQGSVTIPYSKLGRQSSWNMSLLTSTLESSSGIIARTPDSDSYIDIIPTEVTTSLETYGRIPVVFESAAITPTSAYLGLGSNKARLNKTSHGLLVGQIVKVSGVTPSGYNGTWEVDTVAANTADMYVGSNPVTSTVSGTYIQFGPHSNSEALAEDWTVYAGTTRESTKRLTASLAISALVFLVKWQSLLRPDAPLKVEVRTATAGAGTLRAKAYLYPDNQNVTGSSWSLITLDVGSYSWTTAAESDFVYFSSNATNGKGWALQRLDDRSGTETVGDATAAALDACNWTGARSDGGNDQASALRYDQVVLLNVAPTAPGSVVAAPQSGTEVERP